MNREPIGETPMVYRVLVEKDDTEPGRCAFSAYVPDIPNCFTCADTWEELEAAVREVTALVIVELGENGHAYPEPTGFRFLVRIPA